MHQIPILINQKGSKLAQKAFKIFPLEQKFKKIHKRQKTYDTEDKINIFQSRKHDTIDPQKLKSSGRNRRISSSTASNKFPKDFFKQNIPPTPIKIRFSHSRKQKIYQSERNIIIRSKDKRSISYQNYPSRNYNEPINEQNTESCSQVQTPKFNQKTLNDTNYLLQQNQKSKFTTQSKDQNKKIKVFQYLSQKKTKQISKFGQLFSGKNLIKLTQFQYPAFKQTVQKQVQSVHNQSYRNLNTSNKNCQALNQIFLETLGKRQNIMKQNKTSANDIKILNNHDSLKSKVDKENEEQDQLPIHCKKQRTIKNLLLTKGLNWKTIEKINFKKKNSFNQNNNKIIIPIKNQTNKKAQIDQIFNFQSNNNFRIRKFI